MPMIRVATNIPNSDVPEGFEVALTQIVADSLNKPVSRILVEVCAGSRLIHGGSKSPAVLISLRSIGALSPDQTNKHTGLITTLCKEQLGIPADKVIIEYTDLTPELVGFNGVTVAVANASK